MSTVEKPIGHRRLRRKLGGDHGCQTPSVEQLDGRVAVVTGAGSGIGLAIAEAFVSEGMNVVMADLDEGAVTSHAERIGETASAVECDVRDPQSVDAVGRVAMERHGALHVAVNNAGIVNGGTSWELSLEEWHRVVDTNLWGVIHGIRSFVPLILATGEEGHVVNTASMASVLARAALGPYTVAKHGVLGLSDVLRAELEALRVPVGVSVVMPGMIRTGLNPIGTVEPSVVAANVVDALRRGRAYVFTDDHHAEQVEARLRGILAARDEVVDGRGRANAPARRSISGIEGPQD
jgi:NAD(P)-dependent dehydrogenase (short-subunit alcohol dehydrogenase family)